MQQLDDMYVLYQHLDISLPMIQDLDHSHTLNTGPAVFGLLTDRHLLDIVESVIGPEIYSNPVQHARIKPPLRSLPNTATDADVAATLWHQDSAVIDPEADSTDMLTVWLAVTDAGMGQTLGSCLGPDRERRGRGAVQRPVGRRPPSAAARLRYGPGTMAEVVS